MQVDDYRHRLRGDYMFCIKKRLTLFVLAFSIFLSTFSIASASEIRAVATFPILADLVKQVGKERVKVVSIVPLGADPHTWEATPADAKNVASADILFSNGLGFELWLERLIENVAQADLPIIVLSEGLKARPGASHDPHSHHEGDPHFWLNVQFAMEYVRNIERALSEIDPDGAGVYQKNAEEYLNQLQELDNWLISQIKSIPEENRRIITYHDGFGYLAERYGLSVEGFLVTNPDREPTALEMAKITDMMKKFSRKVIFVEPQISSSHRYANALAKEVSGKISVLYSDTLTEEVPSYIDMMRFNGNSLVEALR